MAITDPFLIRIFSDRANKIIYYYFNTVYGVDKVASLEEKLSHASTLFIKGFHPHKSILDAMEKPVRLTFMSGTYYDNEKGADTVVEELHRTGFDARIASCFVYYPEYSAFQCTTMQEAHDTSMRLEMNRLSGMFHLLGNKN